MWPAVVASWLMVMSSGQLELNAPQNGPNQTEMVQPTWKPAVEIPAVQPASENTRPAIEKVPSATNLRPVVNDYRPPANNPAPTPNTAIDKADTPSPALPKPIITRQTYFSLPARSDSVTQNGSPAESKKNAPIVEVQLFVSHDRGEKWNFYTRVKPDQPRIPFRTATDGEYWFATRTLDKAGKFLPQTVTEPAVIVEIDTKPPIILLSADAAPGGQVSARWQISDPHLKPDTLSLQYRISNNGPWQPITISDKDASTSDTNQSGEITWWPTPGTQEIVVRAEISDTAGNKGVGHSQVKLGPNGGSSNDLATDAMKKDSSLPKGDSPGVKSVSASNNFNSKNINRSSSSAASALMNNPYLAYLPPDEKPRMVNSRIFELDYDLQSVGPSGVSRVELFGTRDGGRSWRSFGVDSDNRSPMQIRVDEEGLYGFQIVVTSGAGLGDPPPKSGDKPSIWIGVDLTRPAARITSVEFGNGSDENKLVIAWEVSDKMLAEKPVTLHYSAQPGGQYTAFASNLENSGRYAWSIDGGVPPVVYLRLEAVDEAGNHTFFDYPQPIPLDRSKPIGRIRDVRPTGT